MINREAALTLCQKLLALTMPIDWWKEIRGRADIKLEALVRYCVGLSLSENTPSSTNRTNSQKENPRGILSSFSDFARRAIRGAYSRVRRIKTQPIVF
jgi:hypothetical protein